MGEVRYRTVWQDADTTTQIEAMAFWSRYGLLPRRADPAERSAQLCVLAEDAGALVGVSTIQIREIGLLRGRFAMFRCAVAPDHRRAGIAGRLAVSSRQVVEAWSAAHPARRVLGFGCVVQGAELEAKRAQPVWPLSGLALVGYNARGAQIRVAWFAHATLS